HVRQVSAAPCPDSSGVHGDPRPGSYAAQGGTRVRRRADAQHPAHLGHALWIGGPKLRRPAAVHGPVLHINQRSDCVDHLNHFLTGTGGINGSGLSIPWYSGFGIISNAVATRLEKL